MVTFNGLDTATIIEKEEGSSSPQQNRFSILILFAVVISCIVSVIALIVTVVGISKQSSIVVTQPSGGNGGGNTIYIQNPPAVDASATSDDKIWRFHVGHYNSNLQYLDEVSGQIRGYTVDVVNKVCQIANKNCVLIWDLYENCWNSKAGQRPRGGVGLMGNWYDACVGWVQSYDRARTYAFSEEIGRAPNSVRFYVKKNRDLANYPNFAILKIGFLDGWNSDEHCFARYNHIQNFDQTSTEQVFHYQTEDDIVNAVVTEQIDAFFTSILISDNNVQLYGVQDFSENKCVKGGTSLMLPKANTDLLAWFNPAFQRLVGTRDYDAICQDLTVAHGHVPDRMPDDYCIQ